MRDVRTLAICPHTSTSIPVNGDGSFALLKWFEQEPHYVVYASRRYFAHLNEPLHLGWVAKDG